MHSPQKLCLLISSIILKVSASVCQTANLLMEVKAHYRYEEKQSRLNNSSAPSHLQSCSLAHCSMRSSAHEGRGFPHLGQSRLMRPQMQLFGGQLLAFCLSCSELPGMAQWSAIVGGNSIASFLPNCLRSTH